MSEYNAMMNPDNHSLIWPHQQAQQQLAFDPRLSVVILDRSITPEKVLPNTPCHLLQSAV